jgi:Predicted methyltransferase (contains TPR repeat)
MLRIASDKNVYEKLIHSDIVEYLSKSRPLNFDYFVALDVFIYVGCLTEIFRLIKSRNKKPGKLVFSTEHTEVRGYSILKTGRYAHSKNYIDSLCKKFEYQISYFAVTDLRKEEGKFLKGGIYVLDF